MRPRLAEDFDGLKSKLAKRTLRDELIWDFDGEGGILGIDKMR